VLKSIRLKNFKLHEDTSIEAAPITVFIGPNNSGKSSVFQALLALRQAATGGGSDFLRPIQRQATTADQPYLFPGHRLVDVGEFKDVLRLGQSEIRIAAAGTVHAPKLSRPVGPLEVRFDVGLRDNGVFHHTGRLDCQYGALTWNWLGPFSPPSPQLSLQVGNYNLRFSVGAGFRLIGLSGWGPTTADQEEMAAIREVGELVGNAPLCLLGSLHPVLPLRGFEEWGYQLPEKAAGDLERLTLTDRALAMASIIAYDESLREKVSRWLEEILQVGISFSLIPGKRVAIRTTIRNEKSSGSLFTNEGTGANQLPFILVPIALTPANQTVLLSEPEAHLHPKGQCDLTRMLLTVAKKENIQFFIETHSEHVLHVILNAVGRGDWAKDDVALHYFENVEGSAHVKRLGINEHGQVDGGLPGFFDQSLAELTEYLDALRKH
jgi:energy-coupling factor transporter ATP-binding protein EcfA2